ncbi:MAG: glycoside hydrolase family 2 TIM barrel-domain containing protein [bacterium]
MPPFHFVINGQTPRSLFSLNGLWFIEPSFSDVPPEKYTHTLPVPSLVDTARPEYDWSLATGHWYCTEFSLDGIIPESIVYLKIEQAMFGTQVWMNRTSVGGSISCYTSQEYRIDHLLSRAGLNSLVIKVGDRATLPPASAVGNDQERESFIPGIWGDIWLIVCGSTRVVATQVIPHIRTTEIEVRLTLEHLLHKPGRSSVVMRVFEHQGGKQVSSLTMEEIIISPGLHTLQQSVHIERMEEWSPEHPFLYDLTIELIVDGIPTDSQTTRFGMREFTIAGGDFHLNGKKILLRGSNIAFHRFLSDPQRQLLPWNMEWVKRLLIDIPKEHHFNFFRIHLGQAYNRWYDLADEYGILIQNEWQFWRASGEKEQIVKEFSAWLRDNWNHPSIIIWDALNECMEPLIEQEIIPLIKDLDPTRPWEPNDLKDHHAYIYSLGPILPEQRFGFSDSIATLESQTSPTIVNEFLWWWLTDEGEPTVLMNGVIERWLGNSWTREKLLQHQAWLAQELIELFRRIEVDAIQPFAYLVNGRGATAHWFLGDIAELRPKPILTAIKNAFDPFGVSIELWDRHFFPCERRTITIHVFNDYREQVYGILDVSFVDQGSREFLVYRQEITLAATTHQKISIELQFPEQLGTWSFRARILNHRGSLRSQSVKPVHLFLPQRSSDKTVRDTVFLLDSTLELGTFLESMNVRVDTKGEGDHTLYMIHGEELLSSTFVSIRDRLAASVQRGALLVLLEPEHGTVARNRAEVFDDLSIDFIRRDDLDKGGYDSYVFLEQRSHPLWKNLTPDHFRLFNGGLGGEIVSQHDMIIEAPHTVLARCGLGLKVVAAAVIPYGMGKVLVSRLQVRGRLLHQQHSTSLYDRHADPVAQQLILNLLEC